MKQKIILATSSVHRQKVFRDAGFEFEARSSDIDERFEGRPSNPAELVRKLSELKAKKVAEDYSAGVIIGFDSVGYFNGNIFEKPISEEDAFERLKKLSGNDYSFFTGIYMINKDNNKEASRVVETKATMRVLEDEEILDYLRADKDKVYQTYAQGFDLINGRSSTFIKSINGSYLNILQGIPLETIVEMLQGVE